MTTTPAHAAGSRAGATRAAKRHTVAYVKRYGITLRTSDLDLQCSVTGRSRWKCFSVQRDVGIGIDELTELILLESVKGLGPQKFKELHDAGLSVGEVLREPALLPTAGKRGDTFRTALRALTSADWTRAEARAVRQLARAHEHRARIVTYRDADYPPAVYASNNPIPILYVRGASELLGRGRTVACVGSRDIAPHTPTATANLPATPRSTDGT